MLRRKILQILAGHRIMTVATLRPDGWPQATTVGYASEGLTLYFFCSPGSQKAHNIARDKRVSLTIDHDASDSMATDGLSMAAYAEPVDAADEVAKAHALLGRKYPELAGLSPPKPADLRAYRLTPKVISVLDYTKGFGHTDLVTL